MAFGIGGGDTPDGYREDPQHQIVEELRKIREEIGKMVKDVDRIREVVEQIKQHQK